MYILDMSSHQLAFPVSGEESECHDLGEILFVVQSLPDCIHVLGV